MSLNHAIISGWVVANISADDANKRADAFRDACRKRSEYAQIEVDVKDGANGSKKILFMVTGDSDTLTGVSMIWLSPLLRQVSTFRIILFWGLSQ